MADCLVNGPDLQSFCRASDWYQHLHDRELVQAAWMSLQGGLRRTKKHLVISDSIRIRWVCPSAQYAQQAYVPRTEQGKCQQCLRLLKKGVVPEASSKNAGFPGPMPFPPVVPEWLREDVPPSAVLGLLTHKERQHRDQGRELLAASGIPLEMGNWQVLARLYNIHDEVHTEEDVRRVWQVLRVRTEPSRGMYPGRGMHVQLTTVYDPNPGVSVVPARDVLISAAGPDRAFTLVRPRTSRSFIEVPSR